MNFISVHIENSSNNDIKDLELDFWSDTESSILVSTGVFENGKEIKAPLEFTKRYSAAIAKAVEENQLRNDNPDYQSPGDVDIEIQWALKNRTFLVPEFNRKSTIKFNFLVENWAGKIPSLYYGIAHPGTILQEEFGTPANNFSVSNWLIPLGLVFYTIGLIILHFYFKPPSFEWYHILICVVGLIYYPLAHYCIKITKEIVNYFK